MKSRFGLIVLALIVLTVLSCQLPSLVAVLLPTPTSLPATRTPAPTFTVSPSATPTTAATSTVTPTVKPTATSTRRPTAVPTKKPTTAVPTAVPGVVRLPVHGAESLKPGMRIDIRTPVKGQLYCQITHYEFVQNNRSDPTSYLWAQDKHWAYFYVRDGAAGDIRDDLPVNVTWSGGAEVVQNGGGLFDTWLQDRANALKYVWFGGNPGQYNGDWNLVTNRYGSYNATVGGGAVSDVAVGLGVDDGGAPAANIVQWICSIY